MRGGRWSRQRGLAGGNWDRQDVRHSSVTIATLQLMHCNSIRFVHPRTTGGALAERKTAPAQRGELRPAWGMLLFAPGLRPAARLQAGRSNLVPRGSKTFRCVTLRFSRARKSRDRQAVATAESKRKSDEWGKLCPPTDYGAIAGMSKGNG